MPTARPGQRRRPAQNASIEAATPNASMGSALS
jgi:hypothetical protein